MEHAKNAIRELIRSKEDNRNYMERESREIVARLEKNKAEVDELRQVLHSIDTPSIAKSNG